ncbi:MAG: nuclear transport factor 2 family protein [Candidatus Izemoplasmatales bacterium]|nr:nuclear transport factor 2 family protein [Candidatus Izemoplasmatales bacterium]
MNIHFFWKDVLAQNREKLEAYFHPDAIICWHCSNERYTVNDYLRANCEYPGEWNGHLERFEANGNQMISVVHVFSNESSASFHVVSFFTLENDRIVSLDEYWGDDVEAPLWRKEMHIGSSIK